MANLTDRPGLNAAQLGGGARLQCDRRMMWLFFVLGGLGRKVVSVSAFVDAGVGAAAAGWVESFEEFTDRPGPLLLLGAGGKMPPGR